MKKRLLLLLVSTLLIPFGIYAQSFSVKGNVKDASGEPVIGATVRVVGNTTVGTATDFSGNFQLDVPSDAKELEVSFIGMIAKKVAIVKGQALQVVLEEDAEQLEEVVMIGYQTVKRRDLTGAVSSIGAKDIAVVPVTDVSMALQGKLTGVNVTSQDGRPDATVSIRVRGGGSISQSNDPLVLIDGVVGSLSDIPGDQVESIDVLKDASSTAIYGARGANGVILVTTKGAKTGKVTVSYNGYAKFNTPTGYIEALNPYDYLVYTWAAARANGGSYEDDVVNAYGLQNKGIEKYRNTATYSQQEEVYNSSFTHNHDVTVSGGTDLTKVLMSFNYIDDEGMKINSYKKRANLSLKVNQKIFDNLNVALDARYVDVDKMGSESTTNGSGSILSYAYRFRPIATADIQGDLSALYGGNIENYGKNSQWDEYSPAARLGDYEPQTLSQHARATGSLNWEIVKGLTYHTDLTLSRSWTQNQTWSGAIYNDYLQRDAETGETTVLYAGNATYGKSDSWKMRWTNTLNYDVQIGKANHLNVLLGQEVSDSGGTGESITSSYFPANFTKENAFAMMNQYDADKGSSSFSTSNSIPDRILSFFGRVNYTLFDRYLLTVTMRADGSSKFAPNNRWGFFPAAALAWRINEESFLKDATWLNNLKLRASLGTVGNDGISSSLWSQTWAAQTDTRYQYVIDNQYQSAYKFSSSTLANEDLKWETTTTRNIGIDFGFWNRLNGSVELYWNTTSDLLMATSIPGITGFTTTYANIGQTSNKGIEIALNGVIFQNKNWNIQAGFNINFNKNNVDKLADNVTGLYSTLWASSATRPVNDYVLMEGEPVGLVRGFEANGFYTPDDFNYDAATGCYTLKEGIADISSDLFPNFHGIPANGRPTGQLAYPGMAKFIDQNGDNLIDDSDATIIGRMTPKHTGGFNITAQYKGIDLSAYFNWSYGNQIYNANKLASLYGYKENGVFENKMAIVNDCYKHYVVRDGELIQLLTPEELNAANADAVYPIANNENGIVTSYGIEDGSYLRLGTLTLGYTFPKTLMKSVGLRVYGSIYNLFTLTNYSGLDPEVSTNTSQNNQAYPTVGLDWGAYPRARSFVVGLNLSF